VTGHAKGNWPVYRWRCPFFDTYAKYEMVDVPVMGRQARQGEHLVVGYDEGCELFSCECGQMFDRATAQIRMIVW
jgi:hypothetical protein